MHFFNLYSVISSKYSKKPEDLALAERFFGFSDFLLSFRTTFLQS